MTTYLLSIVLIVLLMWVVAWNLRTLKVRQTLLLLASYLFYSSWGIGFLCVLIASSLLNFAWGSLLRRRLSIGYLWSGIALNVLLLGFFKYLPPLFEAGWTIPWHAEFLRHIVMPVGISFWTFQGLSYLFDVYREEEVDPSVLEFCLYMAFWPVVLSGPVCRLPDMLPQFRQEPAFSWDNISAGLLRLIQGLFMKMVVAQLLGAGLTQDAGVAAGFAQVKGGLGGIDVWLLAVGFGFQLFFDFAGYSHIVIGTARLFGIQLPENFNRPFLSATPSIFWTRWHMSLSFWIRDYVFVSLAVLRRDRWWQYVVFLISMTLFGLWHAAKWTFILWGFYHGLLLVMHRLGQQMKRQFSITMPSYLGVVLAWGSTFLLVSLGWIFFRATDLNEALSMFGSVFSPSHYVHLAMPSSFYMLIPFVVFAYLTYEGLGTSLARWRARYREELSVVPQVILGDRPVNSSAAVIAFELVEFFVHRMWWWLAPMIFVLTLFISLAMLNRSSVVSVTPFMYTVF
jgi:alginate O-acetyltransferase complex protein AlgI